MATSNETHAPTSRKYVTEQVIVIPNWLKTSKTFWSHSFVFPLAKQPKKLNVHRFYTSKRPFGAYFQ